MHDYGIGPPDRRPEPPDAPADPPPGRTSEATSMLDAPAPASSPRRPIGSGLDDAATRPLAKSASSPGGVHQATSPMIELRRCFRNFGRLWAVHDVSFEIPPGAVVGYIGPNGAGKTTSMRILATLDVPTYGDAFIDGFSCVNDPDRVRTRLGFMPDAFGTYSNVNCREYLDFFARAYDLQGATRHAAIDRVMAFTGLDVLADKPISGLSKGMRQRLGLGRALIHDPPVLIMDEPAAGLDPRARIELKEMIARMRTDGKTLLISSHILTELGEMCDHLIIIEQGRLIATGSVEEIRRRAHEDDGTTRQTTLRLRTLDRTEELVAWLTRRERIGEVRLDRDQILCAHHGDPSDEADLLAALVQAGFRVHEFVSREVSLEEVFLRVTRGRVQ